MENHQPTPSPKRAAEQIHHKQLVWQILLPILVATLAVLVFGALAIVAAGSTNDNNSHWAMISNIFLVLPWLIFSLVPLALLILGIWLIAKSRTSLSGYLEITTSIIKLMQLRTEGITQAVVSPLIRAKSLKTGLIHLLKMAFHLDTSTKE